ncbi:MAG: flavin reductase [Anaerolineales bacterium]|nr:flavin reductase [Anaerolineales bacterium]
MARIEIDPMDLALRPFRQWDKGWFALCAGDYSSRKFNAMTVSWGGLGIMWNKPFALAVVRPTRFTHTFTENQDAFTLCAFPEPFRPALNLLGSKSGRGVDKISLSGLTPIESKRVSAPAFAEAELILECRKIYRDGIDPRGFLDPSIAKHYSGDYHSVYFGEVLRVFGEEKYSRPGAHG